MAHDPTQNFKLPKYRRQKAAQHDRAFVGLDGKRHYLGVYGSPESKERYLRVLAEWQANDHVLEQQVPQITVVEICDLYWRHVKKHYRRPDGSLTSEPTNIK